MTTVTWLPAPQEYEALKEMSKMLAHAEGFVPKAYLKDPTTAPHKIFAALLYGRELGIGPMQSLQSLNVIEGKVAQSAELMAALIRRASHSIQPVERTAERCVVRGTRGDNGDTAEVIWTYAEAAKIKTTIWENGNRRVGVLTDKDNWQGYPRQMLWARALSELATVLFPDVLSGASYVPEELGDDGRDDGPAPVPATPRPSAPVAPAVAALPAATPAALAAAEPVAEAPKRAAQPRGKKTAPAPQLAPESPPVDHEANAAMAEGMGLEYNPETGGIVTPVSDSFDPGPLNADGSVVHHSAMMARLYQEGRELKRWQLGKQYPGREFSDQEIETYATKSLIGLAKQKFGDEIEAIANLSDDQILELIGRLLEIRVS